MSGMRNVLIIGNAGAARECYWLLCEVMRQRKDLAFKGFLSFEGHAGELHELAHLQLGIDDEYTSNQNDIFVLGLGLPALRAKAFHKWKAKGVEFLTLIHPVTTILPGAIIGEANIFACATYISCNTVIGNANYMNGSVTIGHDVTVGDANFFGPFSLVLGNVQIGSQNSLGVRSVILANARIGSGNIIAPGAFLYKGCRDNKIMAGNPALSVDTNIDHDNGTVSVYK